MVRIPAGPFLMGTQGWGPFESPVHEVYLDEYWIDAMPVTNQQFAWFVRQTEYETDAERLGSAWGHQQGVYGEIRGLNWRTYHLPGRELHPVVLVSWTDAAEYARWAGLRLPTEAEWEKAARGKYSGLYPWGDAEPDGTQSNFAGTPKDPPPTTPVGQFSPNSHGLYDVVGNVWQWCQDWYEDSYYVKSPSRNPMGPQSGAVRCRRGGGWNVIQSFRLRCTNRGALRPLVSVSNVGFRCCI